MRLFIAILFDDVAVEAISSIRDRLHDEASSGAFVPRENLHLTLEFLGECTAAERYDAAAAIDSVPFQPFPINLDHLGRLQRPDGDLLWIGAEESRELMALQRNLHKELLSRGFHLEKRRFRPHITLARRAFVPVLPSSIVTVSTEAAAISLMLSERVDHRMIYTEIHRRE